MSQIPYIMIAGERVDVPGAVRIVRFNDPVEGENWSFYKESMDPTTGERRRLVARRRKIKGGGEARTKEDLKETVFQVVLHADCCFTADRCYATLVNRALSTHFMLDWDGTLYQGADILDQTYHAGGANNNSIGIDLNNHMLPGMSGEAKQSYTAYRDENTSRLPPEWFKQVRPSPNDFQLRVQNGTARAFGYTDEQYTTFIALMKVLAANLPELCTDQKLMIPQPPMDETGQVVPRTMDGANQWRGIIAHWHLTTQRWDPGPGFDWQRVYHGLRAESNFFPIELTDEQREVYNAETMQSAAEPYFNNTEKGDGGFYPVGVNETWHGGVHLTAVQGAPVRAMLGGQVVAARFTFMRGLGSSNFVLLRHAIPLPRATSGSSEDDKNAPVLTVFSLYMHMEPIDLNAPATWPKWVREAERQASTNLEEDAPKRSASPPPPRLEGSTQSPFCQVAIGFEALRGGHVALFDYGDPQRDIVVAAGEVMGGVGLFGSRNNLKPQVHVEVFADDNWRKAVDLAVHAAHWFPIEDAAAGEQKVRNSAILRMMGGRGRTQLGRREFLFPNSVLSASQVRDFYHSADFREAREYLRRAIVRCTSEWSDRVDWVRALADHQDWDSIVQDASKLLQGSEGGFREGVFSRDLYDILQFTWLTRSVADHLKLEYAGSWEGMVYHFHPIHFVGWLTFHSSSRLRRVSKGLSMKELKKRAEEDRKALEARRERAALGEIADAEAALDLEEDMDGNVIADMGMDMPNPTEPFDSLIDAARRTGTTTLWNRPKRGSIP